MKEATGEANMTVVTIALIAIIAAVAVPIIRSLVNSTAKGACCQSAGHVWKDGKCYGFDANYNVDEDMTVLESSYWDTTNKKCK